MPLKRTLDFLHHSIKNSSETVTKMCTNSMVGVMEREAALGSTALAATARTLFAEEEARRGASSCSRAAVASVWVWVWV